MNTVAALFVDERGPYMSMPGVDAWGVSRDARSYPGQLPVVSHPPCAPWSSLKHMKRAPGAADADAECGLIAVDQVKLWGGVLEQPAKSKLWERCRLPAPITTSPLRHDLWQECFAGFSVEVEQVSWGHVARKKTWLFFVAVDPRNVFNTLRTGGVPTHWCSGGRRRSNGSGGLVPPGIKVCSAQQRRRTPIAFAEWLVQLARSVRR